MRIREIKSSDVEVVIAFHNLFQEDQRTAAQWQWEYKGLYPEFSIFAVIEKKDSIIGTLGVIPIFIKIKGKKHLSGKGENALVHPDYRGGSLFQELSQFVFSLCRPKNIICRWGFTSSPSVWRKKLGFCVHDDCLCESILILNLRTFLSRSLQSKRRLKKLTILIIALFNYSYAFFLRAFFKIFLRPSPEKYQIENRMKSIQDLEKLYNRLRERNPNLIHIDQDEKYFLWRIRNNPNLKYETYFVYEGHFLRGYCYASMDEEKKASLTDFTFECQEAGVFLLQTLLNKYRQGKAGYITFLGNRKNDLAKSMFSIMKRFGFFKRRISTSFVIKNIMYEEEDDLYDIRNWYLNALWTEGYRL